MIDRAEALPFKPSQVDATMLYHCWGVIAGRLGTPSERHHIEWLLTEYGRCLGASAIAHIITRAGARESGKGRPVRHLDYFDSIIKQAHDAMRPA